MAPFGISEGGTASVLSVSVASPEESKTIMALFRAGRGREYDEFDERCTALLDEIGNARVPVGVGQALDLDGPSATWNTRGTLGEEPVPDSVARPRLPRTWTASRSGSAYTATLVRPDSRQARVILTAISPGWRSEPCAHGHLPPGSTPLISVFLHGIYRYVM